MSHSEKRSSTFKEWTAATITGFLYGGTNTIAGHPFDTVKTKMQASTEHMGKQVKYIPTIKKVFQNEGFVGFYRGWVPPFWGSILFRGAQFSAFEAAYTHWEKSETMKQEIPGTGGLQYRVLASGIFSGSVRSAIECPFEYAKVKGQTGQQWNMRHIYKGFTTQYPRSTFMMTSYFCQIDFYRRNTTAFDTKFGQFMASGTAAMIGFWVIWPLEVLKNLAQAETNIGNSNTERARYIYRNEGIKGFYRGIVPGSQSVFLRNGAAMIMMQYAQKKFTQYGFRD